MDQRHHLTGDWASVLSDPRPPDRLQYDPMLQVVADQKRGVALISRPTLSRWENRPSARDLVLGNDQCASRSSAFAAIKVRERGEILLDLDSTDDPTDGQQQLSFFNGAYHQNMYQPMLVLERHTGWPSLSTATSRPPHHARTVPMLLRLVQRSRSAFPGVKIKLRGGAGLALPLLHRSREFFAIEYVLGIPANCVFCRCTNQHGNWNGATASPNYPSAASPVFGIVPTVGRARPRLLQRRVHRSKGTNLRFLIIEWQGTCFRSLRFLQRSRGVRKSH